MKYTIRDFQEQFPDEKACLAFIFNQQFPDSVECMCGKKDCFYPVTKRRCYACSWCGYQIHPTAGTIFHKSPTLLTSWFFAIYLMSQAKNGVSAKELQRQLGVTYKCAWRIANRIRKLMTAGKDPLSGTVEIDESGVGGRRPGKWGRSKGGKPTVMGMLQRGGPLKTKVIGNIKRTDVEPVIKESVEKGSSIHTDRMTGYYHLSEIGYKHETVNHSKGERVRGAVHTQNIDGFWSQMKRSINGTYHHVSQKHLQSYCDEFSFRYSYRHEVLPPLVLSRVGRTS